MRNPRRAMSFLEIMIVIVILGVLIMVSVPTMQGIHRRNKLSAIAREFSTLARFARHQAILLGHYTEIRLNDDLNKYRLYLNPPELNRGVRSSRMDVRTEMERSRFLDEKQKRIFFKSIDSAAGDKKRRSNRDVMTVRFFRNGSATPATIVVEDADNRRVIIQVAGATGAVRISRKTADEESKSGGNHEV